jgi:hypothetical protein
MTNEGNSASNTFAAVWGVLGVVALLVFALVRLTPIAMEAVVMELTPLQWSVLVINVIFMAWSEGYKGFQQRFSPRVAARALHLYRHDVPISRKLLAPFFCFGYFDAPRRTRLTIWIGTTTIVVLVVLVQRLDQPWRGIIDAGVVIGLSWGLLSFLVFVQKTFATGVYYRPPEVT